MAPLSNSDLYHRDSTLSNARFFLGPKVEVDIIDSQDPSGTWHAHLVKTEAGEQSQVFSEQASDSHNALRLLHVKSAQATHQHISTLGFGHPPAAVKTVRGGVASAPSDVLALCSSSSEDEDEEAPDSDDSLRNRRGRERGQRRSRFVAGEAVSRRRCSRSDNDNANDDDNDNDNDNDDDGSNSDSDRPEPVVVRSPRRRLPPMGWHFPSPAPSHPPPRGPLPGWGPPHGGRSAPLARVPPPPGPVMMPPRNMMAPANMVPKIGRPVPALLNIRWAGHGRKNMLVQVAPSEHALRQMALTEARLRPASFSDPALPGVPPPPFTPTDSLSLRAVLRRVTLGGEVYEVTSFGHDLSSLFCGASGIPKFDIEVFGVLVMTPRPRANSMLSENSDDDK